MRLPTRAQLESASELVHSVLAPTPQICWPMLSARCAAEVWVKHENHLPTGAFKVRGGLVYVDDLMRSSTRPTEMVAATRGNHGQSVAFAARRFGLAATIVVPRGNSETKNAAMRAYGATLIEHGHDYQAAYEHAQALAAERGAHLYPPYHPLLIAGVGSYAMELFRAVADLDTVYVPIGLGSGISGVIAAREALGLRTKVVGVVSERAPAYALSFASRRPVSTDSADTIADGIALRVPDADAVELINRYAERIVTVSDAEIKDAMRHYFTDTHNLAEGAGAAPLAAMLKERAAMAGKCVALILSGGNVDPALYREVLAPAR